MPEPHLRASDADRAGVAEVLGTHMSAGRLTVVEYDERLARTYAARTYGELTIDLPTATVPPVAAPATGHGSAATAVPPAVGACAAGRAHGGSGGSLRAAWSSWLTTALIVLTIWAATSLAGGGWLHPWPVWVIGPWGVVLPVQSITGTQGGPAGRDRHRGSPAALTGPAAEIWPTRGTGPLKGLRGWC
ncbi:protein of unknown function [Modestobacter sp. DSM 44400]|uniref:DUF1707 SHOCT-like domain-containing protein n=1 Tax=Modestobacter sp. DSM 44400 TaxID=1550230 RepID=UPI00089D5BBD|nr:DUF1707 domain-containing protein [Modestobacter sp. DSM 44400]SDY24023.1 protein of unknown function [Modestobacter sp. DSM 44400]